MEDFPISNNLNGDPFYIHMNRQYKAKIKLVKFTSQKLNLSRRTFCKVFFAIGPMQKMVLRWTESDYK